MSIRRAQDERIEGTPDGLTAVTEISDVPDAPIIGAVADLSTGSTASVAYTAATTGGTATTFTATSSPGGLTGTGSSPITVSGLSTGVAYTFTVTASNSTGSSVASAASSSLTLAEVGKYESIASVTVGVGGESSVAFTSIPATYTHLQVRCISRSALSSSEIDSLAIRFNSDSGNNYAYHSLRGGGASVTASGAASQPAGIVGGEPSNTHTSGIFGAYIIDILDYANTNKYKTVRSLGGVDTNDTGTEKGEIRLQSTLWLNTSAISTITFASGGSFNRSLTQYSSFALYGIKAS